MTKDAFLAHLRNYLQDLEFGEMYVVDVRDGFRDELFLTLADGSAFHIAVTRIRSREED